MQQYNVGAPMERIALDILGPLPQSATGNKYIVIIADYFTKWPEAFAVPDQEATTVANLLVREFVCRYGVPLEVHSDQGRNFESAVFAEMCTLLGMEKTRTTSSTIGWNGRTTKQNTGGTTFHLRGRSSDRLGHIPTYANDGIPNSSPGNYQVQPSQANVWKRTQTAH